MSTDANQSSLDSCLERFGLSEFREGQREVVEAVLAGQDCLCIMPTGGGKSLCYQLPSIARSGVTLVVSPLIALMKDQVDALQQKGFRADYINSSLIPSEQLQRLDQLRAGEFDMLYVAPERFRSQYFIEAAVAANVQLLAVDEAHCISEWGHDFRHDYARLGTFRNRIGNPQTIALTATATPNVRDDVVQQLKMQRPRVFIAGFARPNLEFSVTHAGTITEKDESLVRFLKQTKGSGIIYSSTRKGCQQIAESLNGKINRHVGVYHAGLMPDDRRRAQEDFMSDKTPIVVATNAFGMGIDKPDVRFVVHYNMPGTIEAYYQEAGRAGRDGKTSRCCLLYSARDRKIQEFFIENAYPSPDTVRSVYDFLRKHPDDPLEITQQQLQSELNLDLSNEGVGTCERLLEVAGALQRLEPQNNQGIVRILSDLPSLVDLLPKNATKRRKILRTVEQLSNNVRHEDVYLRPSDIANQAGLPTNSVSRALRELNDLDAFEYIPPFRGRAIHVVDRQRPFSKLEIDFGSLSERKAADYEKLRHVIRYATSEHCRQLEMLGYFGDPSATECDHCDNCQSRHRRPAPPDIDQADARILQTVRMALSGVARAKQRFGKQMIAAMLAGSASSKISKWKLDKLSTFGLLKQWRQTEIVELLESMSDAGLFEKNEVDRFRPVLRLTPLGEKVMLGESDLNSSFCLPSVVLRRIAASQELVPSPSTAVEATAICEPAEESRQDHQGDTEKLSAEASPDDEQPAGAPGDPETKVDLGTTVVDIVEPPVAATIERNVPSTAHREQQTPAGPSNTNDAAGLDGIHSQTRLSDSANDDEFVDPLWTWKLAVSGFSLDEIVEIRRLKVGEALQHLSDAVDAGNTFDPKSLFAEAMWDRFQSLKNADTSTHRIDSAHWDLYCKCLAARSNVR